MEPAYSKFKVTDTSNAGIYNDNCRLFLMVSHVAHVETALDVARDGVIKAGLIHDKSKLNTERIQVVWLSPNYWGPGFRYGNVSFNFSWDTLIQGKRFYWVESMAYGISACRILVSEKDYKDRLLPYDPTVPNGLWWFDQSNGQHYFNSKFCLEVMLEQDLLLSETTNLSFVDHHQYQCCVDPRTCPDRGLRSGEAGARFLASLIGRSISAKNITLTKDEQGSILPKDDLLFAWRVLSRNIQSMTCQGKIGSKDNSSPAFARAFLHAFARKDENEQDIFASSFASREALADTCKALIYQTFSITSFEERPEYDDTPAAIWDL